MLVAIFSLHSAISLSWFRNATVMLLPARVPLFCQLPISHLLGYVFSLLAVVSLMFLTITSKIWHVPGVLFLRPMWLQRLWWQAITIHSQGLLLRFQSLCGWFQSKQCCSIHQLYKKGQILQPSMQMCQHFHERVGGKQTCWWFSLV